MPGWQNFVVDPLSNFIILIADNVGSFGIAILLITLAIRLVLLPLSVKGLRAQRAIQTLQPKLQVVKDRARGNKQREQQMTMELYKKEGINPLSGCLPLLVQMPVWLAMYGGLLTLGHCATDAGIVDMGRGGPGSDVLIACAAAGGSIPIDEQFLWFNLAQPDATFDIPFLPESWPAYISVMALLSGVTFFLQSYMTPTPTTAGSGGIAASMQSVMKFMPVFFVFIGWFFFSAFLLYWVWTGLIQIVQQFFFSGLGKLENNLSPGTVRLLTRLGAGRYAGATAEVAGEVDFESLDIEEPKPEKKVRTRKRRRRRRRKRG